MFAADGEAGVDGEIAAALRLPAHFPLVGFAVPVIVFKGAVGDQLRVKPAVSRIVDVFKENAVEHGADIAYFF